MANEELFLERVGRFVLFPVAHYSYEFTMAARKAFEAINPAAVAVEYPVNFQSLIHQAIARLPRISVLRIGAGNRYIRIEPVDPFVEAMRLATGQKKKICCMDVWAPEYPDLFEPLPDTYALQTIGHRRYCESVLRAKVFQPSEQDERREAGMAYHLQQFSDEVPGTDPILVLSGLAHIPRLATYLARRQPQPFTPRASARLFHLSTTSLGEIMGHFPFFTSVYEILRSPDCNSTVREVDGGRSNPDDFSAGLRVFHGKKLEDVNDFAVRAHKETASGGTDRHEILRRYLHWCRSYYEQEIGDRIGPQQMLLLHQFTRKYASVKSTLLPGFFELLVAGRGCINSHFCYRMWEIGTVYPPQDGPSELEVIELRAEDIFPLVNKVRMNPNAPLKPRSNLPRFLRRSEKQRRSRKENLRFSPYSICSYQPEDVAVENYGGYLRSKGKNILSEERKRVRPFETSLLDGIDLRETIRNWHSGKIYVQEFNMVKGAADSVVVIFDEDHRNYPYAMTWLGEHNQESDMAFYASDPEERTVGPGIRKAIYGGFLMTMPPGRLFDVFADPSYGWLTDYSEKLLMAAIDYGLEKYVIYAGPKPPRPLFQVIAGRYGKRILYIALKHLSPVMLQRIRTFHILSDKSVRDYAREYIW
jgi:hypothetical protein